jgi:plastocyanin
MRQAATPLRYVAAALLLAGGLVHLKLYEEGYKDIPGNIGKAFLLNVVASVVLAIAVALRRDLIVRVAGILLASGTILAFIKARTGSGILDFKESGLNPSPEALIALIVEIAAIVVLVVLLVIDPAPRHQRLDVRKAVPVAVGAIALTVILGFVWSNDSTTTSVTAGAQAGAVTIADFAFSPKELDVKVGSKVTWTNTDGTTHSVVADDGSFKSQDLDQGATFTTNFSTPGTFTYVCGIHGSMKGTIVVG